MFEKKIYLNKEMSG